LPFWHLPFQRKHSLYLKEKDERIFSGFVAPVTV